MLRVVRKKTSVWTKLDGTEGFGRFDIFIKAWNEKDEKLTPSKWALDVIQEHKDGEECKIDLQNFRSALEYSRIHLGPNDRIFYVDNDDDIIPIEHQSEFLEALKFLKSFYGERKENVKLLIIRGKKRPREEESEPQTDTPKKLLSPQKESLYGKLSKPMKWRLRPSTESSSSSVRLKSSGRPKKSARGSKKMRIEPNQPKPQTSKKNFSPEMYPEESHLYWFRNFLESFERKIIAETTNAVVARLMTSLQTPDGGNWSANFPHPLATNAQTSLRDMNTEIVGLSKELSNIKMTNGLVSAPTQHEVNFSNPPRNFDLISELEHKLQRSLTEKTDNLSDQKFVSNIPGPSLKSDEKIAIENTMTNSHGYTNNVDSKVDELDVDRQIPRDSSSCQQSSDYGDVDSLVNFSENSQKFLSPTEFPGIKKLPMGDDGITLEESGFDTCQIQITKSGRDFKQRKLNKVVECLKKRCACEKIEMGMVKSTNTTYDEISDLESIFSKSESDDISIISDKDAAPEILEDHNFEIITAIEQTQTNQREKPAKNEIRVESCGGSSSFELVSEPPSTIEVDENEISKPLMEKTKKKKKKEVPEMYMSAREITSPGGTARQHIHFSEVQTGNPGEILVDIGKVSSEQMHEVLRNLTKNRSESVGRSSPRPNAQSTFPTCLSTCCTPCNLPTLRSGGAYSFTGENLPDPKANILNFEEGREMKIFGFGIPPCETGVEVQETLSQHDDNDMAESVPLYKYEKKSPMWTPRNPTSVSEKRYIVVDKKGVEETKPLFTSEMSGNEDPRLKKRKKRKIFRVNRPLYSEMGSEFNRRNGAGRSTNQQDAGFSRTGSSNAGSTGYFDSTGRFHREPNSNPETMNIVSDALKTAFTTIVEKIRSSQLNFDG